MDLRVEPPDGTRFEFEHHTDVYAAWRDDASSAMAGWPTGDGGYGWCLYGQSLPKSWVEMVAIYGDSLKTAVRLTPHPDDVHHWLQWPTSQNHWLRQGDLDIADLDTEDLPDEADEPVTEGAQ